jgi:DNA-directed RNA polymerase subunit RPC12/RpoP
VKVLSPGKLPENKVYRARCRNCKAKVEFQQHEAEHVADWRDGDFLRIDCPTCRHPIVVTP